MKRKHNPSKESHEDFNISEIKNTISDQKDKVKLATPLSIPLPKDELDSPTTDPLQIPLPKHVWDDNANSSITLLPKDKPDNSDNEDDKELCNINDRKPQGTINFNPRPSVNTDQLDDSETESIENQDDKENDSDNDNEYDKENFDEEETLELTQFFCPLSIHQSKSTAAKAERKLIQSKEINIKTFR